MTTLPMKRSDTKVARPAKPNRNHAVDAFVVLAMTLTTVALAIGLYLQFRLAFWLAVVAALSVYVGLLALHALVRRSERVDRLAAEVERLEAELRLATSAGTAPPRKDAAGKSAAIAAAASVAATVPTAAAPGAAPAPSKPAPGIAGAREPHVAAGPPMSTPPLPVHTASDRPLPERAVDAIMNDYWAFRPAQPPTLPEPPEPMARPLSQKAPIRFQAAEEPARSDAAAFTAPAPTIEQQGAASANIAAGVATSVQANVEANVPGGGPPRVDTVATAPAVPPPLPRPQTAAPGPGRSESAEPQPAKVASPREADVEMIQGLIKKLADEVNAAEAGLLQRSGGAARAQAVAIETSVDALRTTADQMRTAYAPAPARVNAAVDVVAAHAPRAEQSALPQFADREPEEKPAVPPPLPESAPKPARVSSQDTVHAETARAAVAPPPLPSAPRSAPAPDNDAQASLDPVPWPEAPAEAAESGAPEPAAAVAAAHSRLAALAEAITAGRLDVMLEPILGLADQRTRHFEVSVRLRDKNGQILEPPELVPELRDSGLLPLLDCARIQRSAAVASRLAARGKPGSLFSAFSGEALAHDQFLADFTDAFAAREALSSQLVLSFAQADVRSFAAHDWSTLEEMRELGFRFALQSVTDLDLDLESLKASGFDFVKLDATVFLDGMPASGGVIPAADICRHLAGLGMTLVVGEIEDHAQLARVFGFGVLFGQGQLFGGPRPMKAEALSEMSHAAA